MAGLMSSPLPDFSVMLKLTGMDEVHATHGTTGVVKHPLVGVGVAVGVDVPRVPLGKLPHDVIDDGARVVAVGPYAALGEVV